LPTDDEVAAVLAAAANGPSPALELVKAIAPARHTFVFRSLAWLAKIGVLVPVHPSSTVPVHGGIQKSTKSRA
jgi:hypothetical protein